MACEDKAIAAGAQHYALVEGDLSGRRRKVQELPLPVWETAGTTLNAASGGNGNAENSTSGLLEARTNNCNRVADAN
eukprot:1690148-Prymnesium_polylepis.1